MSAVAEIPENAVAAPSRPRAGDAIVSVRGLTKIFKDFWDSAHVHASLWYVRHEPVCTAERCNGQRDHLLHHG